MEDNCVDSSWLTLPANLDLLKGKSIFKIMQMQGLDCAHWDHLHHCPFTLTAGLSGLGGARLVVVAVAQVQQRYSQVPSQWVSMACILVSDQLLLAMILFLTSPLSFNSRIAIQL